MLMGKLICLLPYKQFTRCRLGKTNKLVNNEIKGCYEKPPIASYKIASGMWETKLHDLDYSKKKKVTQNQIQEVVFKKVRNYRYAL